MTLTPPDWIEARPYQTKAIKRWFQADGHGILRMATGTGKTITALLAAARVVEAIDDSFLLVVAAPYQHLVDQWAAELRNFGADPIKAYESRREWQPELEQELLELNNDIRDLSVVVTTHKTLAGGATQQTLRRARCRSMLIGDEVHHLGADHTQNALSDDFEFRLALSATPERWYDDEGTETLVDYFGSTVFSYDIDQAIESDFLCEYYYVPHIVELANDEMAEYKRLSAKIGRLIATEEGDIDLDGSQSLQTALFKRSRLIGTARHKVEMLVDLLKRESDPRFILVYCGGGRMGVDEDGERHVDRVTHQIRNDCELSAERFTARENQDERKQLLTRFESGELQVLTSIRCLDEGVDVPATKTAYLLANTTNPRQYVQRRGRILRKHTSKRFAVIHDFITIPDLSAYPEMLSDDEYSAERSMIRKELNRVSTFADSARNHPDADVDDIPSTEGTLQQLKRKYELLSKA
jgi:superfamily II DNA or RNA helicase